MVRPWLRTEAKLSFSYQVSTPNRIAKGHEKISHNVWGPSSDPSKSSGTVTERKISPLFRRTASRLASSVQARERSRRPWVQFAAPSSPSRSNRNRRTNVEMAPAFCRRLFLLSLTTTQKVLLSITYADHFHTLFCLLLWTLLREFVCAIVNYVRYRKRALERELVSF